MTNEELAELERLLAEVDAYSIDGAAKDRRYEHLGRWVSLKRKSLIATAREAEALRAENARLREALVAEREENLWSAYATGDVRGDEWTHLYMSDGEWLVRQCGLDPKQGYYKAAEIRDAIPVAARAALKGSQQ